MVLYLIKHEHSMDVSASLQESGAVAILKRAVELDGEGRYAESLINYEHGLELMLKVMKDLKDENKKISLREKFDKYLVRAELLKDLLQKDNNFQSEVKQIDADSVGNSYSQVFGKYLDERVTDVEVLDPYIRSSHQITNFVRFCELLYTTTAVKAIKLTTGQEQDHKSQSIQAQKLAELSRSLNSKGIDLKIEYSPTLHDREIRLNNGWTIKIGRGLDYFKAPEGNFTIGSFDTAHRKCHETTVNIFHRSTLAK